MGGISYDLFYGTTPSNFLEELTEGKKTSLRKADFLSQESWRQRHANHYNSDIEVTNTNEGRWRMHARAHTHKWRLLHASSNSVLHTPTFWRCLAHEGMWQQMHRSIQNWAAIVHVGRFSNMSLFITLQTLPICHHVSPMLQL
jgi:hypothetical protein